MAKPVYEDLDFQSSSRITGLPAPVAADEAATKGYADSGPAVVTVSTTTLTLALEHAKNWLHATHASGCAITVPPQADVDWLDNTVIYGDQGAAGAVTFVEGSGVTIKCADTFATDGPDSPWALIRMAADVWLLTGRLVAA